MQTQQKSINEILDMVAAQVANYPPLKDYGHGHTSNAGTSLAENRELNTPYLWTDYVDTRYVLARNSRGIAYKIYTFSFTVVDKYSPNLKNSQEVMSDTEAMLSDFLQWLANNPAMRQYRIQMETYTATPVRDEDKNSVEGWTVNVGFAIPYTFCYSKLPFNGNT